MENSDGLVRLAGVHAPIPVLPLVTGSDNPTSWSPEMTSLLERLLLTADNLYEFTHMFVMQVHPWLYQESSEGRSAKVVEWKEEGASALTCFCLLAYTGPGISCVYKHQRY